MIVQTGGPENVRFFACNPSHASIVAAGDTVWLAWKEFDGEKTTVPVMVSHSEGNYRTAKPGERHRKTAALARIVNRDPCIRDGATVILRPGKR